MASKLRAVLLFQIRRNVKQNNIYKDEEKLRLLVLEQVRRLEDLYLVKYNKYFIEVFLVPDIKIVLLNGSLWLI